MPQCRPLGCLVHYSGFWRRRYSGSQCAYRDWNSKVTAFGYCSISAICYALSVLVDLLVRRKAVEYINAIRKCAIIALGTINIIVILRILTIIENPEELIFLFLATILAILTQQSLN